VYGFAVLHIPLASVLDNVDGDIQSNLAMHHACSSGIVSGLTLPHANVVAEKTGAAGKGMRAKCLFRCEGQVQLRSEERGELGLDCLGCRLGPDETQEKIIRISYVS
jgi:hypothetical protein